MLPRNTYRLHDGCSGTRVRGLAMIAAWYDKQGPAAEVLQVGELSTPQPGPDEVRVRIRLSGINPGDTKKRSGWLGLPMSFPRIIPHSDGAGVIDAVGADVNPDRIGTRVWIYP